MVCLEKMLNFDDFTSLNFFYFLIVKKHQFYRFFLKKCLNLGFLYIRNGNSITTLEKWKKNLRERKEIELFTLENGRQENRYCYSFWVRYIGSTKDFCIGGLLQNKRDAVERVTIKRNILDFI